jgi:GAF domain
MKTATRLDERSFEQLLAAAYLVQQRREASQFPAAKAHSVVNEAGRLSAIAEAQALVHGSHLILQDRLQLVAERAQAITGGAGAAIWLLRGTQVVCQFACGALTPGAGESLAVANSRLTVCLRDGLVLRCADAKADPRTRYDALPGVAEGSFVAVPIHYEGRVQGALEITFAEARGFDEADVRTCQILSGLISETVTVAAGEQQKNALETERATLLGALDRLQPHLSKLLNEVDPGAHSQTHNSLEGYRDEEKDALLPSTDFPAAPTGPTHGLARLGKYLLDQKDHGGAHDAEQDSVSRGSAREVHTALNFSVTTQQPVGRDPVVDESQTDESDLDDRLDHFQTVAPSKLEPTYAHLYDEYPTQIVRSEPTDLALADEPWLHGEAQVPEVVQASAPTGFWASHGADLCLAASAIVLAVSLTWAFWPRAAKPRAAGNAAAVTASAEPKLSMFEELLVSMGLAEAPPPPATYAGKPATKVWVDISSALYYCPGAEPYGKTPKGKFLTQSEAQDEQFQPARGQPCE